MSELPPAVRLTVWGNGVLAGTVSPDEAGERIAATDPPHRVGGLAGELAPVSVPVALGRLRALGADQFRLVLPVSGDVSGLPGPAAFNQRAVEAGAAVLSVGAAHLALLSAGRGAWAVYPVEPAPVSALSVADAERMLRREVRECTEALVRLDAARWRPEVAELLRDRGSTWIADVPPAHPPQAVALLALARRLEAIVVLAARDEGGAVTAAQMTMRSALFARLAAAVRRATEAACSAVGDDPGEGQVEIAAR